MKRIINKYLLLFLCIFSLVLPTGCEIKEQKQVVVDYQEYHFRNEDLLESHSEKEDGDDVYYKEDTNEFVVVSTDGYIRTYFNPDSGKKYFDRQ